MMDDPLASFYRTKQWRKLRAQWRKRNPSCRRCGRKAELVDHIVDIRTDPTRRLDWFNLQSLCWACHNEKTAADKAGRPVRPHSGCTVDGWPTDPDHPWANR